MNVQALGAEMEKPTAILARGPLAWIARIGSILMTVGIAGCLTAITPKMKMPEPVLYFALFGVLSLVGLIMILGAGAALDRRRKS